jgi:molybdopterin-binding protein
LGRENLIIVRFIVYDRGVAEYKMGRAAALLGVSTETLRRWADAGRLKTRRTSGGHRVVGGEELARFARDLIHAAEPGTFVGQSARNRFPGIVTNVIKDGVMAQVDMQSGPHRIVALMSREAAEELGLAPGSQAVAAVKATNVIVETPAE